jgi:hypothetical protein
MHLHYYFDHRGGPHDNGSVDVNRMASFVSSDSCCFPFYLGSLDRDAAGRIERARHCSANVMAGFKVFVRKVDFESCDQAEPRRIHNFVFLNQRPT